MEDNQGDILNEQDDIIEKVNTFHKKLYSKQDVSNIDLNTLLENFDVPKLSKEESQNLEGGLTYDEVLNAVKHLQKMVKVLGLTD